MSWLPETPRDYARCWTSFNAKILERAERVYRLEDLETHLDLFLQDLGHFGGVCDEQQKRWPEPVPEEIFAARRSLAGRLAVEDYWDEVHDLAEHFGYERQP